MSISYMTIIGYSADIDGEVVTTVIDIIFQDIFGINKEEVQEI